MTTTKGLKLAVGAYRISCQGLSRCCKEEQTKAKDRVLLLLPVTDLSFRSELFEWQDWIEGELHAQDGLVSSDRESCEGA